MRISMKLNRRGLTVGMFSHSLQLHNVLYHVYHEGDMNILACYKVVYDEQDIVVSANGAISFAQAGLKLSLYDLNAVEEAVRIFEKTGGSVKALSAGNEILENSKLRKAILSYGPEELLLVQEAGLDAADTHQVAAILAAAARKAGFDLIICGEGSADYYAQQTGVQLGAILGLPVINAVSKITLRDGNALLVERSLEDAVEVLEVPLPAVLCVTSDINEPRLPGMKSILAAGKKPVTTWSLADLGLTLPASTVEVLSVLAPQQSERKQIILEGEDKITEFFHNIKDELR
jgi:electron transfer flavoprotein beta subunit